MQQEVNNRPERIQRPRSKEQQEASRINGAKSRGPKTVEGKERSKYNALIHGAHSREILLPNEDEAQYKALSATIHAHYNPQDPVEEEMAEQIFTALWKRRRYQAMQQALWKESMHGALNDKQQADPEQLPPAEHLLNEAARWCRRKGDSYAQLDSLENSYRMAFVRAQRNWYRNKKEQAATNEKEALAAQVLDAISAADFANMPKDDKAA